jgi:hypothetical protein
MASRSAVTEGRGMDDLLGWLEDRMVMVLDSQDVAGRFE